MSKMTTERAIEVLGKWSTWKKKEQTIHYCGITIQELEEAIDKAIEVMKESVTDETVEQHRESFKPNYEFIDEGEQ